jgi:class 3 adenylate cyclase
MHRVTRYARKGDAFVAYQTLGEGPLDLVVVQGYGHVELVWEDPHTARLFERFSAFSRTIWFDKLGTGLSDPVALTALPTLEEWMDDVRAVMDDASSERAALVANFEGGPMAILFAATYPERTSALVLVDTYARLARDDDYPHGLPADTLEKFREVATERWRTGYTLEWLIPSLAADPEMRKFIARFERASASPGVFSAIARMNGSVDVRAVLPTIHAPTLVIHRADNPWVRVGHGRYLAEHIPGARFVELPGADTVPVGPDQDQVVAEIQEFLTGFRTAPYPDRVLATVMFTDIVGSTARAAEAGDGKWRDVLEGHARIVRAELANHRGREVKYVGDGFLATFDGPARAIHCAHSIVHRVSSLGIEVRAGLHTGECELVGDDVEGLAVHIAKRVSELADPSEVLVSSTVKDLVAGSGIGFSERGTHVLRGVPDTWRVFVVER